MNYLTLMSLSWQHILILLIVFILPYFIPTFVAYNRKKSNTLGIFMLNLLLGWSLIGWITALVWALSNNESSQQIIINSANPKSDYSPIDQLTKLHQLHEKGVITDEEFTNQKNKLLG